MKTGTDTARGGGTFLDRIEAERRACERARLIGRLLSYAVVSLLVLLCSASWGAGS